MINSNTVYKCFVLKVVSAINRDTAKYPSLLFLFTNKMCTHECCKTNGKLKATTMKKFWIITITHSHLCLLLWPWTILHKCEVIYFLYIYSAKYAYHLVLQTFNTTLFQGCTLLIDIMFYKVWKILLKIQHRKFIKKKKSKLTKQTNQPY